MKMEGADYAVPLGFWSCHVSIGDLHITTSCQFWGYIWCKILDTNIKLATTLNDENWWCQVKMLRYLFIGQFFHRPSNHRGTTVSHTKKPNADQEQILFCLFLILGFLFYHHHLDQRHLLPNNKHGSTLRMPWWNALHYIYIVNYFPPVFLLSWPCTSCSLSLLPFSLSLPLRT